MRAYRVKAGNKVRYAANQTAARATRQELEAELGLKRGAGEVDEVEVPTGKDNLLEWINETVTDAQRVATGN